MKEVEVFVSGGRGYLGKPHWLIDEATGCWVWQRARDKNDYGIVGRSVYGMSLAHRLIYQLYRGEIPKGLVLDHLCRNPSCVNPDHLEPVTHAVNNIRGLSVLAAEEVREIRLSMEASEAVADRLAVGLNTVVECRAGRSYGPLAPDEERARGLRQRRRPSKLSDDDVRSIRGTEGVTNRELARMHGVSVTRIRQIRNGYGRTSVV